MRQYKYFHNPETSKYESIITQSSNEKIERDIFGKLRDYDALDNSYSFVYFPYQSDAYFFQTSKKDQTFSHGLVGPLDQISALPTEYIGLLDKDFKKSDISGELPIVNMPRLGVRPDLRNLQFVFPQLIDALLYGNKRIIFVADTLGDLARYANALYSLVPSNCINKYSFSLGSTRVNPNTSTAPIVQMNLIFTNSIEAYDQWKNNYIVFSVANNNFKTNYTNELHTYSKAIKAIENDIRSWNMMRIRKFIGDVEPLFGNDLPKDEDLEVLLAVLNFDEKNDFASSKNLIEVMIKHPNLYVDSNTYLSAFDIILNDNTLKKEDEQLIEKLRNQNQEIKNLSQHLILTYAINRIEASNYRLSLSKEIENEFIEYCLNQDSIDELITRLIQIPNHAEIYRVLLQVFKQNRNKHEYLYAASTYLSAENTFNFSVQKLDQFIKIIEEVGASDYSLLHQLYASFLVTFFLSDFVRSGNVIEKRKLRMEAFKQSFDKISFDNLIDKIQFLLWVKRIISNFANQMFDDEIDDNDSYKFLPDAWLNELVDSLSFRDCLEVILVEDNVTVINDYTELHVNIYNKVTDLNNVRKNITSNGDLMDRYFEFINYEDNEKDFEQKGIKEYLQNISEQFNINVDMQNERIVFIIDCYHTLSKDMQAHCMAICKKELKIDSDDVNFVENILLEQYSEIDEEREKQLYQKQMVVNLVLDYFKRNQYGKVKKKSIVTKYFTPALYLAIFIYLLTLVLMFTPPVVKGLLLQKDLITEIKNYFNVIYLLIPLYCFILFVINFSLQFFNPENTIKKKCIKKSFKAAFIYGILPVILYLAVYFGMYFLGLVF